MMTDTEKRIDSLVRELIGKDKILDHQTTELFNLNNLIFPDLQEYNRSCPACRSRVWNRMLKWWESNLKNKSSQ